MISFLHPWALAGVIAVAVPVAIHLIRERRRIVSVPSLLLFTNMKRITSRRKLEELFLLCLRCLAVLLTVLLLAAPCVRRPADASGAGMNARGIALGILLDDSPLSEATIQGRRAFDMMKGNARRRIRALSPDSVVLIGSAAAGSVSAPLTPKAAEKILEAMEPLPHSGSLARAASELAEAFRARKGTFHAAVLVEALPFAETWRSFRPDDLGLPLRLFHTDAELMHATPDPFMESAQAVKGGGIEIVPGCRMAFPIGTELEIRSAQSGTARTLTLPAPIPGKNRILVEPSGFRKNEALRLTLRTDGIPGGALARWNLSPGDRSGNSERSSVILLHDGTAETAAPVLAFHAALTLADAELSVRAVDLRKPGVLKELKSPPQCLILPTVKSIPPEVQEQLGEILSEGSSLMIFAQNRVPAFPGLPPELRMQWRKPIRSAAGFDLSVAQNAEARNLFFSLYAKGLSALRLTELTAVLPEEGDVMLLHHAALPVLSIRPVGGAGNLILWGVSTHPLPPALTAFPLFPELLRTAVLYGSRKSADSLFAGDTMNPAETVGTASGTAELRGLGQTARTRRIRWTPGQPAEIYLPQSGFHLLTFTGPGRKTEQKILGVNLRRRNTGLIPPLEREHLPESVAPEEGLKISTLTGDGSGNLTVTDGEMQRIPLDMPLTLALTAVLILETVCSMLSSRRRRETEQC